jgi:hypothetical protein
MTLIDSTLAVKDGVPLQPPERLFAITNNNCQIYVFPLGQNNALIYEYNLETYRLASGDNVSVLGKLITRSCPS